MNTTRSPLATNARLSEDDLPSPMSFEEWLRKSDNSTNRHSPSSDRATPPSSRKRRATAIMQEVPHEHGPSSLELDARQQAAALVKRVEAAAKRACQQRSVVAQLRKLLGDDKAAHTRAVDEAVEREHDATIASTNLELARAQERAAKRKCDKYIRPREVLRFLLAGREAGPRANAEKAARLVDQVGRAHSLARAEADAAWEVVYRCARDEDATEFFLRKAEADHARAVHIFGDLETAAARAENRAVYATSAVGVGRYCWAKSASARGKGREMDPLLFAATLATSLEEGFNKPQVPPEAKRPRH